jgi:hypothetical protein
MAPTATTETATVIVADFATVADPSRAWLSIVSRATAHIRTTREIAVNLKKYRSRAASGSMTF